MAPKPIISLAAAMITGLGLIVAAGPAMPQAAPAKPDDQIVTDAYTYFLGRALVIRQEQRDFKDPGFAWNLIKYDPLGSAEMVNPNFDVATLEAWLAADDDGGVMIEVPEIKDRYYTVQILDEWGEVIANINERRFPTKPHGKFAMVRPGSKVDIPADAGRIELHSSKAKMLVRIELKGDPDGALALQKQFTATPIGTVTAEPAPPVPDFDNKNLLGAEAFDNAEAVIASALDVSPAAAPLQQKVRTVAAYVASGPDPKAAIGKFVHENVVPAFQAYAATQGGPPRNGWIGEGRAGHYGADFRQRAAASYAEIWANTRDELSTFTTTQDADGKPLDGGASYIVHFPADNLPGSAATAFWSIALLSLPDLRVAPNPKNRFSFDRSSKLVSEADGSLKIAIGPQPVPGVPDSNWLPSAAGKPFALTFRAYVPTDAVKRDDWAPPAVTAVR